MIKLGQIWKLNDAGWTRRPVCIPYGIIVAIQKRTDQQPNIKLQDLESKWTKIYIYEFFLENYEWVKEPASICVNGFSIGPHKYAIINSCLIERITE